MLFDPKMFSAGIYGHGISRYIARKLDEFRVTPKKIGKKIGVHKSLPYKWKRENIGIDLGNVLSIARILFPENHNRIMFLKEVWCRCRFFSSRGGNGQRLIYLPKSLSPKLSYFVGALYGDGSISAGYSVRLFANGQEIDKFSKLMEHLFGIKPKLTFYNRCGCLCINSKPLVIYLRVIFGVPYGRKYGKLQVPRIIEASGQKIHLAFIKGLFDTDGYINLEKPKIRLRMSDQKLIEQVQELLLQEGIEFSGPYFDPKRTAWEISIQSKRKISRFMNKLSLVAAVVQPG